MAITVTMYKNFSKKYNSTKQPLLTDGHTDFTCNIKDNTSVLDPVLDLYLTGTDPADTPIGSGYNYAYIPKWNRYYFITDWKYNKGVWIAYLRVDVLASYKTGIGNLSKYVNRSAYSSNADIADTLYPSKSNASVSYVYADNPFRLKPAGSYIVGIIGESQSGVPSIGGINYYLFTVGQMKEFIDYLTSSTWTAALKDDTAGLTEDVVKAFVNPLDYIESCMWFPFEITGNTLGTKVQPKMGWWNNVDFIKNGYPGDATKWGLTPLGSGTSPVDMVFAPGGTWTNSMTITDHPQKTRGNWLDAEPYSQYVFHLDPWGDIPLDGQIIMNNKTVTFDIMCDGISGMGVLQLWGAANLLLCRKTAQVGVSVSIAQIITDYAAALSTQGFLTGGAVGAISGGKMKNLWNNVKDMFQGNWKEGWQNLKQSLTEVGADVANGVESYNSKMDCTGVSGAAVSYSCFTTVAGSGGTNLYTNGPWVKIVRFSLVPEDNTDRGRPLCAVTTISTIPGYIQCADGEHDINALDSEKTLISNYLTGGFFYE